MLDPRIDPVPQAVARTLLALMYLLEQRGDQATILSVLTDSEVIRRYPNQHDRLRGLQWLVDARLAVQGETVFLHLTQEGRALAAEATARVAARDGNPDV